MKQLLRLKKGIDWLNGAVGRGNAWLSGLLVGLVCFDVLMRYAFRTTHAWLMELEWHLFAILFLVGAAYTLRQDRHVRVDVFYARMSARDRAWVDFVGTLLLLLPWTLFVLHASWQYALVSWHIRETSPDPGGLPALYPIKFVVVLGMALLFLQGLSVLIGAWHTLSRGPEDDTKNT